MEPIDHQEEVGRLRRDIDEERAVRRADVAALWSVIESLKEELGRRAAPQPAGPETDAGRPDDSLGPSDAGGAQAGSWPIKTEAEFRPAQTGAEFMPVKTKAEFSPVQTVAEARPTEISSCNIYFLEMQELKHILRYLDCRPLLLARQVCRRWRTAIDDIVEDCRRANRDNIMENSEPVSDLHMYLIAQTNPDMTSLPTSSQVMLDLRVVASSCKNLTFADLRGFTITGESLARLVRRNGRLEALTLPGGCSRDQLRPLIHSASLRRLTVEAPTCDMFQCLPENLQMLDISGLEVSLKQFLSLQAGLTGLKQLHLRSCRGVANRSLASLSYLTPGLQELTIADSPGVTAGGLQHLSKLAKLWLLRLPNMPTSSIPDVVLDSLRGCSELKQFCLGDVDRPLETDIPAAAVSRLVVACRKLKHVCLHTSIANNHDVLDSLLQTDLSSDSGGNRRTVMLAVPEAVCSRPDWLPFNSQIMLGRWVKR